MYNGMGNDPANVVDPTGGKVKPFDWIREKATGRIFWDADVTEANQQFTVQPGYEYFGKAGKTYVADDGRVVLLGNGTWDVLNIKPNILPMVMKDYQSSKLPEMLPAIIPDKAFHFSDIVQQYYLSGKFATYHEAWLAANAYGGYHEGEGWWDRVFRNMGQSHREEVLAFGGGGYNAFGGYGRAAKAVQKVGEAAGAMEKTALAADAGASGMRAASAPTGQFYSVAFEMQLSPTSYPGVTRYMHFKEANVALNSAMTTNPLLGRLGIVVPKSPTGSIIGKSPTNWVWHHNINRGLMQLVPKVQHPDIPGGIFWEKMHPGGLGGYSIWGK